MANLLHPCQLNLGILLYLPGQEAKCTQDGEQAASNSRVAGAESLHALAAAAVTAEGQMLKQSPQQQQQVGSEQGEQEQQQQQLMGTDRGELGYDKQPQQQMVERQTAAAAAAAAADGGEAEGGPRATAAAAAGAVTGGKANRELGLPRLQHVVTRKKGEQEQMQQQPQLNLVGKENGKQRHCQEPH